MSCHIIDVAKFMQVSVCSIQFTIKRLHFIAKRFWRCHNLAITYCAMCVFFFCTSLPIVIPLFGMLLLLQLVFALVDRFFVGLAQTHKWKHAPENAKQKRRTRGERERERETKPIVIDGSTSPKIIIEPWRIYSSSTFFRLSIRFG